MTEEPQEENLESIDDRELKIEGLLPVTAAGIESLKEANPEVMSPHRNIYKWFARRPTAATRLAVLASVLPADTTDDQLLRWMCVGPDSEIEGSIEDYVINRFSEERDTNDSVTSHYGYDYPLQRTPSEEELDTIHEKLESVWDGSLPTVLDPTAGGGTIPLESFRYGLPTISNELNPVAWLLNKVILDYTPKVGSLRGDLERWMEEIKKFAKSETEEYFPKRGHISPSHYFRAYSIKCTSCGNPFPLTNRWWFNKRLNKAITFELEDSQLRYDVVDADSIEGFDPNDGTVSRGDAECPHCGVITERDTLMKMFREDEFEYEVCGVRYESKIHGTKYHSPTEEDYEAIEAAAQKVENDLNLATLLDTTRFEGRQDRAIPYGITKWRDVYSPRQLISHYALLQGYNEVKPEIKSEYGEDRAEAILVLLSLISTKLIERNSRLVPLDVSYGSPANMLGNNNFAFQRHFGESNLLTGTYSYETEGKNVIDSYEEVVDFVSHVDPSDVEVLNEDASDLPCETDSIDAVIMDPPYGDNVIYSEISDAFYVWLREYLSDLFPSEFADTETDKTNEAVENPATVADTDEGSSAEMARERYENKMADIFSEAYRVLSPGGVLTVYFTDKEASAWDSLTMGLIRAGFTITATHTITSEMPQRVAMQGSASADSTLLLTCRKPLDTNAAKTRNPTLWSDISTKTREVARQKATELLGSDLNLTKTDTIISAYGPTLRIFTESYPVVDKRDNPVRPKKALEEARTAVVEVLVEEELEEGLGGVDNVSRWYILSWLVYGRESIPYDDARQLGLGVGVDIDDIKTDTKIWSKSGDTLILKGQSYRVRDYTALEAGEKRRKRAYPVDPRDETFSRAIDAVHASLNILDTKGSDFTWNWLNNRNLADDSEYEKVITSLLQVLPNDDNDKEILVNLVSGKTGDLLDIDLPTLSNTESGSERDKTTLSDF
jgi:adenine-specific DNA methylase